MILRVNPNRLSSMMEHGCLDWQLQGGSSNHPGEGHPQLLADLAQLPVPLSVAVRCGVDVSVLGLTFFCQRPPHCLGAYPRCVGCSRVEIQGQNRGNYFSHHHAAPDNTRLKVANLLHLAKHFPQKKPAGMKGALEIHTSRVIFAEAPSIRRYIRV